MGNKQNRQIVLKQRPTGSAKLEDFQIIKNEIPSVKDGEILFQNIMISVEPYQRNLMGNGSSELDSLDIGETMQGPTVAKIIVSKNNDFKVGDYVQTWSGWQDYGVSNGSDIRLLDPKAAPLSTALGPLGLNGFAAWYGMTKLHDFKPNGTLVVTGAAGSVGSLAAQLGKLRGYRVVGVAGGKDKVNLLREDLGLDAAIDYKATDLEDQVRKALPDGIDSFYENVGGPIFPILMEYFNKDAKMTISGTIADYSNTELPKGTNYLPRLITIIHYRFLNIKAFATPFVMDSMDEFLQEVTPLIQDGKIKYSEEFVDGFDKLPETFLSLFDGSHSGKKLIVMAQND
ncbi:NADP-dependent oxidoreductase [Sphingobacterium oryzagri]|uniref:NADP-dependent oxidoreductase n=1 Tax=Sphingobacterium oryzagri TaxID=3025669 RepID=A0ABY7WBF3_9SPHI|nr:NADP-dependent oxidoreductase [Sphingobacterium sp. KACC 22765]WDF66963.1 NADP-dependent oxidoreductase [Sphingobacterium sp. KACC 22765]